MGKKSLTMSELKSLLLARFRPKQSKEKKVQGYFYQMIEFVAKKKDPRLIAIENKLVDRTCGILARRLMGKGRTTPFLSSQDFDRSIPLIINEIAREEGVKLKTKERKRYEKFAKVIAEEILAMVYVVVPHRKNPYKEYWRWVAIVLGLAAERGIQPTELLTLENAADEITRWMFTKKQFIALYKRAINKLTDAEAVKKNIIQPILDIVAEGDEEKRRKREREVMWWLDENLKTLKPIINAWFKEEVERIYGVL